MSEIQQMLHYLLQQSIQLKKIKFKHEVYAITVPLFLILCVDLSYLGQDLVFL